MGGGKPVNALVIFHLDGCVFCEMTLGTVKYNFAHEDIFTATGIQPYQVLVSAEGQPVGDHVYCADDVQCIKEADEVLGANVSSFRSFPTTYFYAADGKIVPDAGVTKCGIAVRGDADRRCTSTDLAHCDTASNDMDNWVCNLHTGGTPLTDCSNSSSREWTR